MKQMNAGIAGPGDRHFLLNVHAAKISYPSLGAGTRFGVQKLTAKSILQTATGYEQFGLQCGPPHRKKLGPLMAAPVRTARNNHRTV